jgi:hypothetical protein
MLFGGSLLASFAVDQLVQPADLALGRLQAVPLQLEGVRVDPLRGPAHRGPEVGQPFLHPGPAALEDAQPGGRIGPAEEREADAERVVLPRRRTGVVHRTREVVLAVGRDRVDDLLPPPVRRPGVGGDQSVAEHRLQTRVERPERQHASPAELGVDALAELVTVHRRFVQQTEYGELQDPTAVSHDPPPSV